jgi:hypothetical protein
MPVRAVPSNFFGFGSTRTCNGQGPIQTLSPMEFTDILLRARQTEHHDNDKSWTLSPTSPSGSRNQLYWKNILVSGIEFESFTPEEGVMKTSRVCVYGCRNEKGDCQSLSGTR